MIYLLGLNRILRSNYVHYLELVFATDIGAEVIEPPLHEDDGHEEVLIWEEGLVRGQDHVALPTLHVNIDHQGS